MPICTIQEVQEQRELIRLNSNTGFYYQKQHLRYSVIKECVLLAHYITVIKEVFLLSLKELIY